MIDSNTQWRDILNDEKVIFCSHLKTMDYEASVKRRIKAVKDSIITFQCNLSNLSKEEKGDLLQAELERVEGMWLYPVIPIDEVSWEIDAMKWAHNLLVIKYRNKVADLFIEAAVSEKSKKWVKDNLMLMIQHNLRQRNKE